jgi:hypothetical protein
MTELLKLIFGVLASLFKSRAKLEAEILVLRQQINVLRRRAPKRPHLNNTDRFLFVWLYRWFPSILGAIAIVRPETIIRWHRAGFRVYWRWRSRNRIGRPKVSAELRTLIGEISGANPLWGAPRIHGELLKLGFEVAVSGLENLSAQSCGWHCGGRPVCPANGRVPDALLPYRPSSRTTALDVVWCDIKSDRGVDLAPDYRGVPVGPCASIPHQRSGHLVRTRLRTASARHGHSGSAGRTPITLAKCLC